MPTSGPAPTRACDRRTSRSPSLRLSSRSRASSVPARAAAAARRRAGSSSAVAGWCIPTSCATVASTPSSGAASRSGSGSTAWPRSVTRSTTSATSSSTTSASWNSSDRMGVPLSWLKDFAPIEADTPTLVDTLNELGLVVDGVDEIEAVDESVVVARVLATRAHPGADKVQLVDVDAGGEQLQIVCGAFNFGTGDLVSLARLGTVLPNGAQIDRRQVRGEWSEGMLCSAAELGLSDDHNGILVLAVDTEPGVPLRKALAMEPDVVFELDVTPNRPDAMSVAGVARDLAATLGIPFSLPDMPPVPSGESPASVAVKSKDLCPRFTAIILDGVSVGPSPAWLARRLTLAGMRPINNVVDVSNYVMLELGQPNHPYDLSLLPGNGLLVRRGKKSETVTTLDEVERPVGPDDCLICDAEGTPVGIGGVMGGASSEIADGTTSVLLETAYFDPMAIARTARRLGLRTEASARFERGVDYNGLDRAVARSLALLAEVAGARPVGGLVDVRGRLPKSARPVVRTRRVNEILGTALTGDDVRRYLEPIGFECAPARGGWRVTVPSWRPDSELEIDVIEEVARHHGYSNIPRTVPLSPEVGRLTPYQHDRRRVREVLAGAALSEASTPAHGRDCIPPGRRASSPLTKRSASWARSTPPCWPPTRSTGELAGSPSTCNGCWRRRGDRPSSIRSVGSRPPTSTWRSLSTTRRRPPRSSSVSVRSAVTCSSTCASSTCSAVLNWERAGGAWPTGCGSMPSITRSPTKRSARSASAASTPSSPRCRP